MKNRLFTLLVGAAFASFALAAEPAGKALVDISPALDVAGLKTDSASVRVVAGEGGASAVELTMQAGKDYPGVHFTPAKPWDLSGCEGIEVSVTNPGDRAITVCLRVDNPGDWTKNPWNAENQVIPAGATKIGRVTFGKSWGNRGFALDPAKISDILVFADKQKEPRKVLINSIKPFGKGEPAAPQGEVAAVAPSGAGTPPAGQDLLTKQTPASRFKPSSGQVISEQTDAGLVINIQPGAENYPGLSLTPEGKAWDFSAFGHVEAKLTNLGTKSLAFSLRVDNAGDWKKSPWNCENLFLKPGATGSVKVIFGRSYGQKPGYALKTGEVINILMFTGKSDAAQIFRIDSLKVGGQSGEQPAVDPQSIRTKPKDGKILEAAVGVSLPAGKGEKTAQLKPSVGRWDLRDYLEARVTLRNDGQSPVSPRVRLDSNGGSTEWTAAVGIAPGASHEFAIRFARAEIWTGPKESGTKFAHDAVSGITIGAETGNAARALTVVSAIAMMPPTPTMPEWLGKRPPVDGEWVQTFVDEFDGGAIDAKKWNIYGENFWDKQSHFSKDNAIIGDGVVKLRFERKTGHQNDDPNHKRVTDYATGFLDTYGKWVQRYGYFESRMKLPKAPGLWPAFWMMPDRGEAVGPQWKRADTANGGMEMDIMEHLTRWGPNRYNIAMHWDGYGKEHKSTGSEKIYIQPDKDGYITSGLLWLPGKLVFYCQGQEVARWENERVSSVPGDLMFTLPMGGWDNSPLDDKTLPDDFVIDYVRCWQRKDLASDVDGFKTPSGEKAK